MANTRLGSATMRKAPIIEPSFPPKQDPGVKLKEKDKVSHGNTKFY